MATDGNVRCLQGSTLWEAVCTSNGNGRATEKASQRGTGRDGPGRLCPGMGRVGQGSADINNGYLVPGICSRVSEEWGLDGHAGNVGLGTLLVEYALLTFPRVPCVPRGARLVCSWRLLCWRQLRLPLSGYRGAFLRPPSF